MQINLPKLDEPKLSYTLPLYQSVRERLETLSARTGVTVANLVRSAVNDLLDREVPDERS